MDARFGDVATARRLVGLSGAGVFLASRDDKLWFVRKIAATPEQSPRLRRQAQRQRGFAASVGDALHVPNILDDGERDGCYFFDMELVRGLDGPTFVARAPFAEIASFTERLNDYLRCAAKGAPLAQTSTGLFEALFGKICEVQRRTAALAPAIASNLFFALEELRRIGPLAPTLCHGDLTLENLIIDERGRIWVLDLLDAPFEHWWFDVAKLHQDLGGGWYLRRQPTAALGVTSFISERVLATATALDPAYAAAHDILLACNFARILPYVTTQTERDLVTARVALFAQSAVEKNR